MLEAVAVTIGFFGASLIGVAVIGGSSHPRIIAIIGTALALTATIISLLILLGTPN